MVTQLMGCMSRRLALFAGMVVWLLMATTLRAATDGLAGPSSTGTARVTLAKGDVVLISNITDVAFPQWTAGMGAQMAYGQACVYSSTGGYLVKAISSAGGAAFALADDSGYRLPYLLNWQDRQQTPTVEIALESGLTNPTRHAWI